jgi:hypothetical protein
MSSSLPLALAVLLGASSAVWAADEPLSDRQGDVGIRAMIDVGEEVGGSLALNAADLAGSRSAPAERSFDAYLGSPRQPRGERAMPALEVRLGRVPAIGRSPGAAPPAYGEIGIDVGPRSGVSIVPSYRVVLDNDLVAAPGAIAGQILKLAARFRF